MDEVMRIIFESYSFVRKWHEENIEFYANKDTHIASYFLIRYIDGTGVNENADSILTQLNELEKQYINSNDGKHIKKVIHSLFDKENEAAQIDKNTSAIFPIRLSNLDNLEKYRNLIYSVEESPYYFRRFVVPYTEKQVDELLNIISDNNEKSIYEILSEIANDVNAYYDLASHKNLNNVYEFVIRLFSKVPFLQYNFKAEQKPMTIEQRIELELPKTLRKYHDSVKQGVECIEQLLQTSDYVPNDEDLDAEISELIGGKE